MLVTRMLRDSRIAAREAAAMPFPNEETTPPVTKTYFAIYPTRGEMTKFTGIFFCRLRESAEAVIPAKAGMTSLLLNRHTPIAPRPSCRRGARHEYFPASP